MIDKCYKDYYKLRNNIDERCKKLWDMHSSHMQCKSGCFSCCRSFKVFPVEFHAISNSLKNKDVTINPEAKGEECKFLVQGKCSIYNERPIICRTHGYPLVRLNEEAEAYEVSYCELNFKEMKLDKFGHENTYDEDKNNSELYIINKEFISLFEDSDYDSIELVPVNNIITKNKN